MVAEEITKAQATVATNTTQCVDFGRKKALLYLAQQGIDLRKFDLDCAEIDDVDFPPGTKMEGLSFVGGRAIGSKFAGADMWGIIASDTNFTNADFSNAVPNGAIFGRHLLFAKNGDARCHSGADLTDAKFDNANLEHAWLLGVKCLTCQQLMKAKNWSQAVRDDKLSCGMPIP